MWGGSCRPLYALSCTDNDMPVSDMYPDAIGAPASVLSRQTYDRHDYESADVTRCGSGDKVSPCRQCSVVWSQGAAYQYGSARCIPMRYMATYTHTHTCVSLWRGSVSCGLLLRDDTKDRMHSA